MVTAAYATRHSRRAAHSRASGFNETKSAVAQPEERKFLGFSIENDGSERRIAPKALDTFKKRIREMTRRTRGRSLTELIKDRNGLLSQLGEVKYNLYAD